MLNQVREKQREKTSVIKIERMLYSEGYGVNNPQIDTLKIAQEVFNLKCVDCNYLIPLKVPSILDTKHKRIFLNPELSEQRKKIEVAKLITKSFYSSDGRITNKVVSALLLPPYIYSQLKKRQISKKEILNIIGFAGNKFLEEEIEKYDTHHSIIDKLKSILQIKLYNK